MTTGRIPSIEGGIQPTIFDAKADLLTATAADTPARLAVGANDTVLTADSSTATGLKWAAPASGAYTSLASGSLSGSTTTLSSIAGSYKNLRLIIKGPKSTNNYEMISLRCNNDTTANLHKKAGNYSTGTTYTAAAATQATSWSLFETYTLTTSGIYVIDFFDYANTDTMKLVQIRWAGGAGASYYGSYYGQYLSTSAITQLDILIPSTFTAGTYTLYGEN